MNWSRYIKRTAVRRIVWIVVGLGVYGVLGVFGQARAQAVTIETAYQACMAALGNPAMEGVRTGPNICSHNAAAKRFACRLPHTFNGQAALGDCGLYSYVEMCPGAATWDDEYNGCNDCASRSRYETNRNVSLVGPPASYECNAGCEFVKTVDVPGRYCILNEEGPNVGYWCNSEYNATGAMCTGGGDGTAPGDASDHTPQDPNAPPIACGNGEVRLPSGQCSAQGSCPLGQHEVNGACQPVGNCPAGHVKAPDGSCAPEACPVNYVRGPDGTCKVDQNNDGTPDEDEPGGDGDNPDGNRFSGGDSCKVPPTCSGDAIMCGQARIQWRIDCNTRTQSSVHGGDHCDNFNMPVCVGENCDPVEHKQMIIQWRAMCALESLVNQEGNGEGDDGGTATVDIVGIGEGAVDGASGTSGDGGDGSGAFTDGSEGGGGDGQLDTGGLGFGTSCPSLPSVNVLGVTLDFNEIGPTLCDWMSLGGYIVLILSSLLSLRILAGGMNV